MTYANPACEPRSGGRGHAPLPPARRRSPGRSARCFRWALTASVLAGVAGCVGPSGPIGPTVLLTAHPNPSADGAFTVSWAPVAGASKYRLHENGAARYEGPDLAFAVADAADGSYVYALTWCVVAFGIEACNFKGAELTVTVSRHRDSAEDTGQRDGG